MTDDRSHQGDAVDEKHVFPTNISNVPNPNAPGRSSEKSSLRSTSRRIDHDPEKNGDLEAGLARSSSTSDTAIETTEVEATDGTQDPNIVDWDGSDDPYKAINWTSKKKWSNVAVISSITFLTPLASSMFAPGNSLLPLSSRLFILTLCRRPRSHVRI